MVNQSSCACFFQERVALPHTLFHHQCHLKARPGHQDPLECNALCVPAQDAHLFTLGLSDTTPSRFKLVRPRSTHSLRSGIQDAVHSKNRRRVHQVPLGHNTRLVHHCHTTVAVCKSSTTSCTSVRTRLGQGNNTTASPLGSQVLPSRFSTYPRFPLLLSSTKRAATASQTMSCQTWPWTLQHRRLDFTKMFFCCQVGVCGLRADSGMQRMADQDVQCVVCLDQNWYKTGVHSKPRTHTGQTCNPTSLTSFHTSFLSPGTTTTTTL